MNANGPDPGLSNNEKQQWDDLGVITRLEVGPVTLRSDRLTALYRVVQKDREDTTELVYRFEEDVFIPGDPASMNLACMIAAQVALNYGLFCDEIIFHGFFDQHDRSFLREMARNTAREIFVKKFLEPNPFLIETVKEMPPFKRKNYLRANLIFSENGLPKDPENTPWSSHPEKHAVLSSGGKDSLLSFGLLSEMGVDVHPVFINESGRHWFTALNAYRYFKDNIPNTARVWMNTDRLFAWMLRRMPFIRKDFGELRSDQYPIRLWTVSVFLFGVLPLLRKRDIGRLLIGDEFDTTVQKTSHGIPHYDGLYDQSILFDNSLSRYFMRKGWAVSQFSVLRPLSELLIEKVLTLRYPYLQEHQISCHAAHKEGERVYPCGKCEKCRRIVNMLLALNIDPGRCGYRESQFKTCLKEFIEKGVSQEEAGVRQLRFMLMRQGLIEVPDDQRRLFKEQPEILQLRFDPKASPMNAIPMDLRAPLLRIFLEYADGAVHRIGRSWEEFDPLSDPDMRLPFAFEIDIKHSEATVMNDRHSADYRTSLWGELTWPDAQKYFKEVDIALLPVGAIEQHGPHLPLDTDAFDADYLARRVAEACSDPKPFVLPAVSYGVSYHHEGFQGTISISNDTLSRLIYEIGISISRNGIKKLVIINGHGGNSPALNYAAQMINRDARIFVCVDTGETSDVDIYKLVDTPNDVHAGEIETSTSLAVRPHLVKMDRTQKAVPAFSSRYLDFTSKRGVLWYAYTRKISNTGVMGDPTKASADKGKKIWEIMIAHLVALVEDLKRMTLEEIHHQRY